MEKTKLIYVCPGNYKPADGIYQKILHHTKQWEKEGVEVKVITYDVVTLSKFMCIFFRLPIPFVRTIIYYLLYTKEINKLCKDFSPDIIYSRHFLFPFFISKKPKLILEVNGDIEKENTNDNFIRKFMIKKSIGYYDKNCSAVVLVTDGLSECFKNVQKKVIIPNSILSNASEIQENANLRAKNFETIKKNNAICFMASKNRAFYAVNEIVELVSNLKKPHTLWIIGDIKSSDINVKTDLPIYFWGMQSENSLRKLLLEAKIGIGTLNVKSVLDGKSSPLKVRTYLQHGLPVFTEDNDIDFNSSIPFFKGLKFDDNKKIVDCAPELEAFIETFSTPNYLSDFSSHITKACVDVREVKRVQFIKSVINE